VAIQENARAPEWVEMQSSHPLPTSVCLDGSELSYIWMDADLGCQGSGTLYSSNFPMLENIDIGVRSLASSRFAAAFRLIPQSRKVVCDR
jgi:hypothetical protein